MRKKPIRSSMEQLDELDKRILALERRLHKQSRIIVIHTAFWVGAVCAAIIFI